MLVGLDRRVVLCMLHCHHSMMWCGVYAGPVQRCMGVGWDATDGFGLSACSAATAMHGGGFRAVASLNVCASGGWNYSWTREACEHATAWTCRGLSQPSQQHKKFQLAIESLQGRSSQSFGELYPPCRSVAVSTVSEQNNRY